MDTKHLGQFRSYPETWRFWIWVFLPVNIIIIFFFFISLFSFFNIKWSGISSHFVLLACRLFGVKSISWITHKCDNVILVFNLNVMQILILWLLIGVFYSYDLNRINNQVQRKYKNKKLNSFNIKLTKNYYANT